jgi:hypothetical protein
MYVAYEQERIYYILFIHYRMLHGFFCTTNILKVFRWDSIDSLGFWLVTECIQFYS